MQNPSKLQYHCYHCLSVSLLVLFVWVQEATSLYGIHISAVSGEKLNIILLCILIVLCSKCYSAERFSRAGFIYALYRYVRYLCIYSACMSRACNRFVHYSTLNMQLPLKDASRSCLVSAWGCHVAMVLLCCACRGLFCRLCSRKWPFHPVCVCVI